VKISNVLLISTGTFLLGLVSGKSIEKSRNKRNDILCGSLRLDKSEADVPPRLFLELEVSLDSLSNRDVAVFRVINESYISHK